MTLKYNAVYRRKEAETVKFLGLYLDGSLSWQSHIEYLCKRLASAVYGIRRVRKCVGREAALMAYHSLFQSVMSYGIVAWGGAAEIHLHRVFVLQKAAVRSIVGAAYLEHCRPIYLMLRIMTLYSMIVYHNLWFIKANIDSFTRHSDIHDYDTRGREDLLPPHRRLHKTTLQGIKFFNKLPLDIRSLNLRAFKSRMRGILTDCTLYSFREFYDLNFNSF